MLVWVIAPWPKKRNDTIIKNNINKLLVKKNIPIQAKDKPREIINV